MLFDIKFGSFESINDSSFAVILLWQMASIRIGYFLFLRHDKSNLLFTTKINNI